MRRAGLNPRDPIFSIHDRRLERGLLSGAKVFRIPDSAISDTFVHPTASFPQWNLCVQQHDQSLNVIHNRIIGCPRCRGQARERSKNPKFAIRFVLACANGHLDDVPWTFIVHRGQTTPCQPDHVLWLGTGASLTSIILECPNCHARRSLGEIYQIKPPCSGWRPETGIRDQTCGQNAVVVQRGSTLLRIPEVITSLTIPPARSIHTVLQRDAFEAIFRSLRAFGFTEENFLRLLAQYEQEQQIPRRVCEVLREMPWEDLKEAIDELQDLSREKTPIEYLQQEHRALENAALEGYPPYPSESERRLGEPPRFQVNQAEIRKGVKASDAGLRFRVMPIERLRVVLVQRGFRRVEFDNPQLQPSSTAGRDPQQEEDTWFPGVDHFGEGLFIDLDPDFLERPFYPQSEIARTWESRLATMRSQGLVDERLITWNALSLWWHTLSHRLVNALAIHSGYSSSSIRERIYLTNDEKKGLRGGIVLYTTQAGGDGTLGGLTSLANQFEEVLDLGLESIDNCSNDPLCEHAEIDDRCQLGAACYSCLLISETSCEHMNQYLDRRLLLGDLP